MPNLPFETWGPLFFGITHFFPDGLHWTRFSPLTSRRLKEHPLPGLRFTSRFLVYWSFFFQTCIFSPRRSRRPHWCAFGGLVRSDLSWLSEKLSPEGHFNPIFLLGSLSLRKSFFLWPPERALLVLFLTCPNPVPALFFVVSPASATY